MTDTRFVGRDDELRELAAWCRNPERTAFPPTRELADEGYPGD